MSAPAILHFGSPAPQDFRALAEVDTARVPEGPKSILSSDDERAAGRDRAMTYAVSIAKEGTTDGNKLVSDARVIYDYLYTEGEEAANPAA